MEVFSKKTISDVLFGANVESIKTAFYADYESQINEFILLMEYAFKEWGDVEKVILEDSTEENGYVSALIYAALHSHIVSLQLFISGLLIPSGNTQRYVLESIALSLLCSKASLGVRQRYMENKYSTTKAVRDVVRHHETLNLDRESLKILEQNSKFYHQFSHPTPLSLTGIMFIGGSGNMILGGAYDPGKIIGHDQEIKSRVSLARLFPDIIRAVEYNFER